MIIWVRVETLANAGGNRGLQPQAQDSRQVSGEPCLVYTYPRPPLKLVGS